MSLRTKSNCQWVYFILHLIRNQCYMIILFYFLSGCCWRGTREERKEEKEEEEEGQEAKERNGRRGEN